MSDMHKADSKIRFLMKATESPTYSNLQLQVRKLAHPAGISPMSTLALDLSDATLDSSPSPSALPIRRLTLGDVTPTRDDAVTVPTVVLDQMARLGVNKKRLLKNTSVRFGGSPKESPSGRQRGVTRRIDLTPVTGNDENAHPAFAAPRDCEMPPLAATAPPTLPASSPSKFAMMRHKQLSPFRHRQPLEDYDPNSQDSGFGADKCDAKTGFRFAEPFGLAPRRQLTDQSPRKENSSSPRSKSAHHIQSLKLFSSQSLGSSNESLDDGFVEFFDYDKCGEDANMPSAINSLFDKPLYTEDSQSAAGFEEKPRPSFRRSLSLMETNTPNSSRARSCLFSSSPMQQGESCGSPAEAGRPFKRPESPGEYASGPAKRRKSTPFHDVCDNVMVGDENLFPKSCVRKSPVLKQNRCFAETEATIMTALHRASQEPDLIGDFSMPYLLPLMDGRHPDLKTISHDTLAHLVEGRFNDEIDSFTIVDCRYPYEFDGGHIRGATNVYTRDQVLRDFVGARQADAPADPATAPTAKRKRIVVFHCEFSSERGPNLYRYLRNVDRDQNKECYPSLHYPELYLLNGGYKLFFEHHGGLCEPQSYRPMLHPSHESELKLFRAKSKSWSGDSKSRLALRSSLKRLGL